MPLPDNFSPAEHLQDTVRRYLNREVREWFRDVDFDNLDINTPRSSLATACQHDDNDSMTMTMIRMSLFDGLIRQRFQSLLMGGDDGTGTSQYKERVQRKSRPQIILNFTEDIGDVQAGFSPVYGRISFRLMDHTSTSITPAIATTYATRIKTNFANAGGFVWKKGKEMASYTHWEKGYQLQLLVRSEAEGRRIVENVLDIQNDTPDWSNFNYEVNGEAAQAFPTIPSTERIFGETRRLSRIRPVADVRFQWAQLLINGMRTPVVLVDRSGSLINPLVS